MGLIRLLLAVSVVLFHMQKPLFGLQLVGGFHAVVLFFMISGFYMAMILNEKYSSYGSFIKTRLLKIFPTYWLIILICVLTVRIPFFKFGFFNGIYLLFSNFLIVSSNLISIIFYNGSGLSFLPVGSGYRTDIIWGMLYIGPIWSLSIELIFYFLAPFLLVNGKLNRWLKTSILIIISFITFVYLNAFNSWIIPWSYNLFVSTAYLFALGAISFFIYSAHKKLISDKLKWFNYVFLLLFIFWIIYYQFFPTKIALGSVNISRDTISILLLFIAIPFLFTSTKRNKLDRFIGNLAYPVYISHFYFINHFPLKNMVDPLVATIIFSIIVELTFIRFIEKYRMKMMPKDSLLVENKN